MSVASVVRRLAASAALLAGSAAVADAQAIFFGFGGDVSVRYVFSDAGDTDQLYYRVGSGDPLMDWGFQSWDGNIAGGNYTSLTGFRSTNLTFGGIVNIGPVCAGCEVVFMLRNETKGVSFYTGSAARNPGSEFHANTLPGASGLPAAGGANLDVRFGFEDIAPLASSDSDFNDIQFEVAGARVESIVPEPSTYALMASGLLALGVAARRRRKV